MGTRLFRSRSCGPVRVAKLVPALPTPYFHEEDEEEEQEDGQDDQNYEANELHENQHHEEVLTNMGGKANGDRKGRHLYQISILDIMAAALRKSLVTCSVETEDLSSLDISSPINVTHVSHVTFDRFNGFLGLPKELEPEVPKRVPSASASAFGVSAKSMQCSFDDRGNSVPTILLMMQKRLYSEGGLRTEGIFRINAENSQEECVRSQLNKGVLPHGIDVHCLAGLMKAWFRELPTGVLDLLTPEQVIHCNREDDCTQLVKLLPPTEAALLDWAINLMADVVQHEQCNKMSARNIAMVFAPNMTQMADPLTALIHAVQVMNFLKTLILKTLREREESDASTRLLSSRSVSPNHKTDSVSSNSSQGEPFEQSSNIRSVSLDRFESNIDEKCWSIQEETDGEEEFESVSGESTPARYEMGRDLENKCERRYHNSDGLKWRKGVWKLCRHPVFQLSKPVKKNRSFGVLSSRGSGEALA